MKPQNKFLIAGSLAVIVFLSLFLINKHQKEDPLGDAQKKVCASKEDRSDRIGCWERTVEDILKNNEVDEALKLLQEVKKSDLLFSSDCHVYAHLIGEISYWKYRNEGQFVIDDASRLCDYGFYHGFMQEMGHHDDNFLEFSPELCSILTEEVDGENKSDALNQCFHGIGHGVTFFYIDEFPNNELEITTRGIDYCRSILEKGDRQKDCVFGIYGGISSLYFGTHSYLWQVKDDDPFWICDSQPLEFRQGCYVGLVPAIFSYWEFDLHTGMDKIDGIEDITYARESAFYSGQTLSHKIVVGIKSKEEIITLCQSLERNINLDCIKGLVKGIKHYSLAEMASEASEKFCDSEILTKKEKEVCVNEKI